MPELNKEDLGGRRAVHLARGRMAILTLIPERAAVLVVVVPEGAAKEMPIPER